MLNLLNTLSASLSSYNSLSYSYSPSSLLLYGR